MSEDMARELYKLWRDTTRRSRKQSTNTGVDENNLDSAKNEDPLLLQNILNELVSKRDWNRGIAEGSLFTEWRTVVGEQVGSHSSPISLLDGTLTIQATSSAWATQLTLMESELLKTISQSAPGALVENIKILPPGAPSWKKGLRTIRNSRGPRDTYG